VMQEPPLIQDPPWAGGVLDPVASQWPGNAAPDYCWWLAAGFPDSRAAHNPLKPPREGRGREPGKPAKAAKTNDIQARPIRGALESTLAPPLEEGCGLGSSGPTIPTAGGIPQERSPLLGGGVGWPDDELQRSPTRPAHGEPPGWMCARSRHPPILQLARSRPPKAPHWLLLARPRQEPMPRCNSETLDDLEGANLDDPVMLADDAEVH